MENEQDAGDDGAEAVEGGDAGRAFDALVEGHHEDGVEEVASSRGT